MVPAVDEYSDLDRQLADRGEGAAVDRAAFDDPELDFAQFGQDPQDPGGRGEWPEPGFSCSQPITLRVPAGTSCP